MNTKLKQESSRITAYELTTALLRGGLAELELNATASLVLMYLCSCYNGGIVFPHIRTIAENIGLSESGVKKAIKELINKGCILKSKMHKGNNSNIYTITNKVIDLASTKKEVQKEHSKDTKGTFKSTESVLTCNKSNNQKLNNLSDEDKKLIAEYVEQTPTIQNKQSYLKKVLQSDCTLLLKRLKEKQLAEKQAKQRIKETEQRIQEFKENEQLSVPPTKLYLEIKEKLKKNLR